MQKEIEQVAFTPPPLACDAHFHIFGDPRKYPYKSDLRYTPQIATADDYLKLAARLGIQRMVLVQPSCFGMDNSCQLDAAEQYGTDRVRVVVDVDETVTEKELHELHQKSARGIRINVNPVQPLTYGLAESLLPKIRFMEERCKTFGWSLDFLFPDWLCTEMIPYLDKLRVPFTIAHMGMNKACNGTGSRGFKLLVDLARNGEGYCWIKLTAPYRVSLDPEYTDVVPLAQAVIEAAPRRVVWGSDYPHASFSHHDTTKIFNLLLRIAPDEAVRKSILVDNPSALYGF